MTLLELVGVVGLAICVIGIMVSVPITYLEMTDRWREHVERRTRVNLHGSDAIAADDILDTPVPYDPEWLSAEKEKVDTASISVIVLDRREVPGTENEGTTMNNYSRSTALLPTGTNISLAGNPTTNEYFEADATQLVIRNEKGQVRVAQTWGGEDTNIGDRFEAHHDQAGYRLGLFTVIGIKQSDVEDGEIPTKKVPLYVFK